MKALTEALNRVAPPSWLMLSLAALLATTLLAAFVVTLQENVRHGEEFRQAQRVGSVRQAISTVADAAAASEQPELR